MLMPLKPSPTASSITNGSEPATPTRRVRASDGAPMVMHAAIRPIAAMTRRCFGLRNRRLNAAPVA